MWAWIVRSAVRGGRSPQTASTSASTETTLPALARRTASTSRSFGPLTATARPSRSISKGPSTRNDSPRPSDRSALGSAATSWTTTGAGRPLSSTERGSPNTQPDRLADTERTASEHRTVPGSATAHRRAASTTAVPWRSPPSTTASPTLIPTRSATPSPVCRLWSATAPWIAVAQRSAEAVAANAAITPSPVDLTAAPACAATASEIRRSRSARTRSKACSPTRTRISVEPTMSVNRTVQVATCPLLVATAASLRRRRDILPRFGWSCTH